MEQQHVAEAVDTGNKRQFCTFWLAERLFGVDILNVKEINPETEITPIFHAPEEVKGYVNIRGQIHLVLDLRLLMGFEKGEVSQTSRIVLFKPEVGESFGVLVDQISDVLEVTENQIEDRRTANLGTLDVNESDKRTDELMTGVYQLEDNLLVILNAKNFLTASTN